MPIYKTDGFCAGGPGAREKFEAYEAACARAEQKKCEEAAALARKNAEEQAKAREEAEARTFKGKAKRFLRRFNFSSPAP